MTGTIEEEKYVLLIEDDVSIRESLQIVFDYLNVTTFYCQNGLEALDFLSNANTLPSLILLDLRMPVMDGEVFRKQQLEIAALQSIPTVLLSADTRAEEIAARLKIEKILGKPFKYTDLVSILKSNCTPDSSWNL